MKFTMMSRLLILISCNPFPLVGIYNPANYQWICNPRSINVFLSVGFKYTITTNENTF